jgi:hypothetical protein
MVELMTMLGLIILTFITSIRFIRMLPSPSFQIEMGNLALVTRRTLIRTRHTSLVRRKLKHGMPFKWAHQLMNLTPEFAVAGMDVPARPV